ncbi:Cyclic nucleotide-binding domain-containing protein [Methylomagnum ishizawai]|uniref:Cyclic nucleotide-binding domain-containing protein n=1 Tax=Methylomagnum ishizawai TaxID=1760988 RepID=A0A1Y6D054_9GAMM|nr:cyclic nucleotide-binding domain-containing protein [Methylomagnum ishizawai]SMF95971.1 Cyclic nucleotide-binding domain-containing protein [Methylomagnum ishizawai]
MQLKFRDILREPEFINSVRHEIKHYPAGATIIEEGSAGTEIYLILEGATEIYAAVDHLGPPGRTTEIARSNADAILGELSLFEHQPRTASVVATCDCQVAVIDGKSLESFMDRNPGLGYWILRDIFDQVVNRMRETTLRSNAITALYLNDYEA